MIAPVRPPRFVRLRIAFDDLGAVSAQAHRVYPGAGVVALRRRLSFRWSAWRHPVEHRALVTFFSVPPWDAVARTHPQVLQKVHKPYALRGLDVAGRIALVQAHYRLARTHVGPALLQAVAEGRDIEVMRVPLPEGRGALPVLLGKQTRFEREGELTLSLHDPFDSLLYSMCFTLRDSGDGPALLVGSLNGTAGRPALRHLTKLSHGVRPASLVVALLQMLAREAGIGCIEAVGLANHAYWGNPRHEEIRFDYDAFWREEGGIAGEDGLYRLPTDPRRRDAAEVPSQKRALYARRYAWLDEVGRRFTQGWRTAFGDPANQNAALAETPANHVRPGAGSK